MTETATIFALASAPGKAGVAVLRVSGPAAGDAVVALTGQPPPAARRAVLRRLRAADGAHLDTGLVLWFAAPASFTGEDCAEFHVHGGRAIVTSLLQALSAVPGCRMADAGEFTRRALFNDKLDLTQVEALADLIAAQTQAQQRQALRQLDGHLSRLYEAWGMRLLQAVSHLEAAIDFADEDIPPDLAERVHAEVAALAEEMGRHLADNRRGERLRDGIFIAILGAPNVGKSSLINLLAQRDVAIVSAIAGTTRDVLDTHLDLGGYPVIVSDTAGIREEAGEIEAEGIRRALARAEAADIVLVMTEAASWPNVSRETAALLSGKAILVVNKTDTLAAGSSPGEGEAIFISVKTGAGIEHLLGRLAERVVAEFDRATDHAPLLTRARHRAILTQCRHSLDRFLEGGTTLDLAAEDLRFAIGALGRIVGKYDVEDFLDVIFRDFCIGK